MELQAQEPPKRLEARHLSRAVLLPHRNEILTHMPKNGVVCEVGTRQGHFARKIVDVTQPTKLHLIDRDWSRFERASFANDLKSGRIVTHDIDSSEGLLSFDDGTFDWIYIDADHSYTSVKKDIEAAAPKLKKGGYIIFNDYIGWTRQGGRYGVIRAVNEFCVANDWRVEFLALSKGGYNDIVLREADAAADAGAAANGVVS